MNEFFNEISAYLKAVFWESARWVFSLFDGLGIILFFLPNLTFNIQFNKILIRSIGFGIFFISFVVANFLSYRDLLRLVRKKPATINIQKHSVVWTSGGTSGGGEPISPLICRIYLDVRNDGDEQAKLLPISVGRLELSTPLLGDKPSKVLWHRESDDPNRGDVPIKFPILIDPRSWNLRLRCQIEMNFPRTSLDEWVKRINEFGEFLIELCYEYERFDGERCRKTLSIEDTFSDFRKSVLKTWMGVNRHDLVCNALNIESLIDELV